MPELGLRQRHWLESKGRVLVMVAVKITSRKKRPHVQTQRCIRCTLPSPAKHHCAAHLWNKNLLNYFPAGNGKRPLGPRLRRKTFQAGQAIGRIDSGRITLRRERVAIRTDFDFCIESIYEHHSPRRRRGCGKQQCVVSASCESRTPSRWQTRPGHPPRAIPIFHFPARWEKPCLSRTQLKNRSSQSSRYF